MGKKWFSWKFLGDRVISKPGSATHENHHWKVGGKRKKRERRVSEGGKRFPLPHEEVSRGVTWLPGPCPARSGLAAPRVKHH